MLRFMALQTCSIGFMSIVIEMVIAVFESAAASSVAERMLHDVGERCHLAECNLLLLRRRDPCREASVVVKDHHKCLN